MHVCRDEKRLLHQRLQRFQLAIRPCWRTLEGAHVSWWILLVVPERRYNFDSLTLPGNPAMRLELATLFVSLLLTSQLGIAATSGSEACTQGQAELEANKQLLRDFFAFKGSLEERADRFLASDYIQHNPRLLRLDAITGATGKESWLEGFKEAQRRRISLVDLGGIRLDKPIIVMAECDLVTAIYKGVLDDPDRPGETYEAFAFETFRVRDAKFSEHWDQVTLRRGWMEPRPAPASPASAQ
jgi:predicted SnoaL-like aldol condensation-catalyzing enzyme